MGIIYGESLGETRSSKRTMSVAPNLQTSTNEKAPPAQSFENDIVHRWYRIVFGYSDRAVNHLIEKLNLNQDSVVLDPFCGAGTTVVECKKQGISSIGIDANPSSVLAARVKTNWDICPDELKKAILKVKKHFEKSRLNLDAIFSDPSYKYIVDSGMLKRGWICQGPLREVIALKIAIDKLKNSLQLKNALRLALVSEVVMGSSNVRFGPELYCGTPRNVPSPMPGFESRVQKMALDLSQVANKANQASKVYEGDARQLLDVLSEDEAGKIDAIITSPPYPTEHDYTRNARLELVLLGFVENKEHLRTVKKTMLRSHTKGIYVGDKDSEEITDLQTVNEIVSKIESFDKEGASGFELLYGKVIKEYFGGMKRHFEQAFEILKPGGFGAYIVGDQASYRGVKVETAKILSEIAQSTGFEAQDISLWRERWSSSTSQYVNENILIIKKPLAKNNE